MSKSVIEHEVVGHHDILRFGLHAVKGDIVGSHPLQSLRDSSIRFWEEKKRMGLDLTYGSAFNLRRDFDAQILSRFQRPPGALPSSMLGFEAFTGGLDEFGFEDYLNLPQDSESIRPLDLHHGMEVRLGITKGPHANIDFWKQGRQFYELKVVRKTSYGVVGSAIDFQTGK